MPYFVAAVVVGWVFLSAVVCMAVTMMSSRCSQGSEAYLEEALPRAADHPATVPLAPRMAATPGQFTVDVDP